MGQMSPSISPTILHQTASLLPIVLTPPALASPWRGSPTPRAPTLPPEPPATTEEQEGDGWEAAGWRAGAASKANTAPAAAPETLR